jgi:hypothetical protein
VSEVNLSKDFVQPEPLQDLVALLAMQANDQQGGERSHL